MALTYEPSQQGQIHKFTLQYWPQVTVDIADAAVKCIVPFAFTVLHAIGRARSSAGSTPHTDVDVDIYANTTKLGTIPVVDGSALTAGGSAIAFVASVNRKYAADSFLHMKLIDITGGSSPTLDGLEVDVYVTRD